jgi:UPF0755 protein
LLAGAGVGAVHMALSRYEAAGPLTEGRSVVVPHGGAAAIGKALSRAGVIESAFAFHIAALATRGAGNLRAGEFAFPEAASLREVLLILRTARPVQHAITIPEGLTIRQIAALLDHAVALIGDALPPAEGAVLPQTYAYELGTPRAVILERAHAAMQRALADAWQKRTDNLPLASPTEALILASIVERETARPEERPHVAAVFLNRLRIGMKLQSDPTVVFAVSGGTGTLDRKLTRADIEIDNPYNTYRHAGLPPGPIAAPGIASITAVTQPLPESDDLYFVADGSGGHSFARTLEAHHQNVTHSRDARSPQP